LTDKKRPATLQALKNMVGRERFERSTIGLKVLYFTLLSIHSNYLTLSIIMTV